MKKRASTAAAAKGADPNGEEAPASKRQQQPLSIVAKSMAKATLTRKNLVTPTTTIANEKQLKEKDPIQALKLPVGVKVVRNDETLLWLDVRGWMARNTNQNAVHVPPLGTKDFLYSYLFPIASEEYFLDHVFHKRAMAITGFGRARVESIVDDFVCGGDVSRLVSETASDDGVSVWIPNPEQGAIESFKVTDAQLSETLFRNAGASLYMRAPKTSCEALTKAAFRALKMPFHVYQSDGASRGEVEVFLASKQSKRTPTHTDFQENFTMQLRGKKTWRLHLGDLLNPLRAKSPHFANTPMNVVEIQLLASQACGGSSSVDPPADDVAKWVEVELDEGDVLYHPPGIWHNVKTTGVSKEEEICLSINISLVTPTWADIVSQAIRQYLWMSPVLRRPVAIRDIREVIDKELPALIQNAMKEIFTEAVLIPPEVIRRSNNELIGAGQSKSDGDDDNEEEDDDDTEDATIVMEFSTTLAEERNWTKTTVFRCNPLALMIFDSDVNGEDDEDEEGGDGEAGEQEEETFSVVVHINIGSSDLESLARFELMNLPLELKPLLQRLRDEPKGTEITGEILEQQAKEYWLCVADMLVRCGWFVF